MRTLQRVLAGLSLLPALTSLAAEPSAVLVAKHLAGQSIYRDGLLLSGKPVRALVQKKVVLSGAEAACVNCHRRSGLGGSEGQNPIRPIVGQLLFTASQTEFVRRRAVAGGTAEARPAYTRASLARALREGIDPSGRVLDPLMPRYALGDAEIAQLYAYLEGLSVAAPGVTDRDIHFATIIAPGVDPDRRAAMLNVLQAFFRDKNGGTRKESRRRDSASEQMYLAYRNWVLHVWDLQGAPETWPGQLDAHYRQQPVFAVIGGLGDTSGWQPVHAFCEAFEVPCVFPDVDYPDVTSTGYYPLYFSRGVALEAEVLAKHLLETDPPGQTGTIVQVYHDTATGRLPAQVLRDYLHGKTGKTLIDYPLAEVSRMPAEWLSTLVGNKRPTELVVWLDRAGLDALELPDAPPAGLAALYMSAGLSSMRRPNVPEHWLGKLRMIYPFDLPTSLAQRLARMKVWLRARSIPLSDERTQANAFFSATVTGDALSHLGENFSRDYFIERIEQMTQSALSPSIYPRLSLGPGQRFASRGGYVVEFPPGTDNSPVAISQWLIP